VRRLAAALVLLVAPATWGAPDFDAAARDARALLARLVAADTSNPPGNEARAVAIGEAWLRERGISFESHEFAPGRKNLVARLAGDGSRGRPLLILAHVDVVGTKGQVWATDPRQVVESGGYLLGRGVADDLGMATLALEVLGLLAADRVPLGRDVIVAWTGDEESEGLGIQYALKEHRAAIDAEVALNEGGGLLLGDDGAVKMAGLQVAEKVYQDFVIRATGPTGHSSAPLDDNAIARLGRAMDRLGRHRFPVRMLEVTREGFLARAQVEDQANPRLAAALRAVARSRGAPPRAALAVIEAQPSLRNRIRTTCVPTQISGGTRENALPAEVYANVNCRILPDEKPADVARQLAAVIADPRVEIRAVPPFEAAGPSPLSGPVVEAVRKVMAEMHPGVPVVPAMSPGATDSRYLRMAGIAAYGFNPIGNTETDARRAHGVDERIPASQLRSGVELLYRLVVEIAGKR
jgi:acetylornithine deacetylase/succinyl-diaminopimelate desuccinylase-like protein